MTLESSASTEGVNAPEVVADTTSEVTGSTTDTTSQIPGDTTASPPTAEGEKPKSLLDAIRKVVAAPKASPAPDTKDPNSESKPDGVAEAKPAEAKDGEEKPPPFHEHPRWKQVIGEREGFKRQVSELTPDATSFRQVRSYMEANSLTPADVKQGFAIMAALRNDPAKARELLEPTLRDLRVFLGDELPADLQAKVEDGSVDEATARETARLRNVSAFENQRTQQTEQRHASEQTNQAVQRVAGAVDRFVADQQAKDPDFKRVEPLLAGMVRQKQAEWANAGKPFNSVAAAVALTQEAIDTVKKHLGRPTRQEIKPTPTSGTTSTAAAPPKTMLDAVKLGLARSRGE